MTFWSVRGLAAWGADWAIRSIPEDCTTESHYKVAGGLELKPPFFRDIPPPRLLPPIPPNCESTHATHPPFPHRPRAPTNKDVADLSVRLGAPRNKGAMSGNASRPWRRPTKFAHLPPTWSPDQKKGCQWRKRLPDLRPRTIPQFLNSP